jgi:hypothetical protein
MFAKLLLIITAVGATACALLVIRQQRIDTFHEMSQIHQRLLGHERTLWQLRTEIAQRCRPTQVRLVMNRMNVNWVPIPAPRLQDTGGAAVRLASTQRPQ